MSVAHLVMSSLRWHEESARTLGSLAGVDGADLVEACPTARPDEPSAN